MTIYGTEFLLDIALDNVNYHDKNTKNAQLTIVNRAFNIILNYFI